MLSKICLSLFICLLTACVSKQAVEVTSGPGKLKVSPDNLNSDFRDIILGSVINKTITLKNTGGLPLTRMIFSEIGKESSFTYQTGMTPGEQGACQVNMTLKPGESCNFGVSYSPLVEGISTEEINLTYNDGLEPKTYIISLNGNAGLVANLVAEHFDGNFGVYDLGGEVDKTITIRNDGGLEARNFSPSLAGNGEINFKGGSYPGIGGTCGSSLKYQQSCTMVLTFRPTIHKTHVKQVTLAYKAPVNDNALVISLSAISAVIQSKLVFLGGPSGSMYDYKKIVTGNKSKHIFTVVNAGYLEASNINISISAPFSISYTDCTERLEVSSICSIEVEYAPTAKTISTEMLTVTYNNGNITDSILATVTGEGLKSAELVFMDTTQITTLDMGSVPINGEKKQSFLIKNIGDVKATGLTVDSMVTPLSLTHACGTQLLPGQSCFVEVTLKPTSAGNITPQDVKVNYHNEVATVQSRLTIQGKGVALGYLEMTPIPNSYDFGKIIVGRDSAARTVTLTNTGLANATAISPILPTPFYYLDGTMPGTGGSCPSTTNFTLTPGASCTFKVIFTPDTAALRIFYMSVTYHNGEYVGDIVKYTFSGTGETPANLIIEDTESPSRINYSRDVEYVRMISVTNDGTLPAELTSVALTNNTTFKFNGDGTFPGLAPTVTSPESETYCGTIIQPNQTCYFSLILKSSLYGLQSDTVTINFENGATSTSTTFNTNANFDDLGHLLISDDLIIPSAVIGGASRSGNITLTNTGTGPINTLMWTGLSGEFSKNNVLTDCTTLIPSGSSCTFTVDFSAATPAGDRKKILQFDYDNGMDPETNTTNIITTAMTPANLKINLDPFYDYGLVIINTTAQKIFSIKNSGSAPAMNVTLNALNLPFTATGPPCGGTIAGNGTCFLTVDFTPTSPGVESTDTIQINYNNGIMNTSTTRDIKGTGETPPSNHGGWAEIYAIGNSTNTSNNSLSDKMVRLKWNDMTPTSESITSYNVYRSSTPGEYDWNNPIGSNISTASKTFIDMSISPGNVYYYTVSPVILGYPSRLLQSYGEVRVVAPPNNMALGHRWMINQDMCNKLGRNPDKLNNHRCTYSDIGNSSGYYDIGVDLLVDRFELGNDFSSNYGQLPIAGLTQNGAKQACALQNNVTIAGSAETSFIKRVLSRREWMAIASWPSNLTDTQITNKEGANTNTTECNGNGSALENTGNNTNCRSKYGIENAAGNVWEWVSDRILDGKGMINPDNKLDPTNKDFDNVEFGDIDNGLIETLDCYNKIIGIPRTMNASSLCPADTIEVMSEPIITFRNDHYWGSGKTGAKLPIVGGSYTSNTNSGIYSLAWVDFSFNSAGARCGFSVKY